MPHAKELFYRFDANDTLVEVGPNWDDFAMANGGAKVRSEFVLRHRLAEFVTGPEVLTLFQALFKTVRENSRSFSLPFRCDAPDRRRYMNMDLAPADKGGVMIRTRIMREVSREPASVFDVHSARSDGQLRMCAWCNRIALVDEWLEVDDAIRNFDLFSDSAPPRLTHGICPDCMHVMDEELAAI